MLMNFIKTKNFCQERRREKTQAPNWETLFAIHKIGIKNIESVPKSQ